MPSELREKTISGMLWNALERFGSAFFLFLANLVLARLLSPDDFGAIAMLMVFISLSEAMVDGGFGSALIQKQSCTQRDYSTIFVWNIVFALILYGILFVSAPVIADFYNIEILKDILRLQGLVIPLNSLTLVHIAFLRKRLKFKKLTKVNLLAIIVGTIVGVVSAFYGAGVWSLVLKLLLTAVIQVICFYTMKSWTPSFIFDYSRFKSMFRFASFIFLNKMINTIYHNILSLIIGKCFNAATLGYYNQARKLEDIPRSTLSSIVNNVSFPVFSQINNDIPRLREAASKCMRNISFIAVPCMIGAMVVAKPLFIVLFTTKWFQAVPYFQLLCLGGLILTPLELNSELLNAIGRSGISLNIRIFQQCVSLVVLLLGIQFGMIGLLIAYVVGQYFGFVLAGIFSGRFIGYGLLRQIKDIYPFIGVSMIAVCFAVVPLRFIIDVDNFVLLLIQIILFIVAYVGVSIILKFREIDIYINIIREKIKK